jgi:simple sugar transport system permease protein
MLNIINIIIDTFMYSAPLIFGALGGVISERSGVINIGIEGMMFAGAFTAATVGYFSANPWFGLLCGGLAGGLIALLHAIASITFKADQNISGIALNLIGPGFTLFISRLIFEGVTQTPPVPNKLPKLFMGFDIDSPSLLALITMFIVFFVLYKTKWGLRIRAVGELPAAVDTLGMSVDSIRYICVVISGVLAGFGGGCMTLSTISNFTQTSISGQGFVALAAVIFGQWTPHGTYLACLLFSLAQVLTVTFGGGNFAIPTEIINMFPYLLTILVLVLFVGKSAAPKADGKPYIKGSC